MISNTDIARIFSEFYAKASLDVKHDMRFVADLLESIRGQLDISDPYATWEFIILDKVKFDNDYALELLMDLKNAYFALLFEKMLRHLDELFKNDKKEALGQWYIFYAEAAVYYRYDMICMLCCQRRRWRIKDDLAHKYSKLPAYIRENRWPDAFTFYEEIAANDKLTTQVRAYAEITLMEIVLYYFPESMSALKYLEGATALLPGNFLTQRAEAIYNLKTGKIQKARNGLLRVIAMKPGDYLSINLIGDCFLAEGMLEIAESWYNDAIKINFQQADSYQRLLGLYGNKNWIVEKETLMENFFEKIEKRRDIRNSPYLIGKNLATADCFINLMLYESYRNIAASWLGVRNLKKSEEWYTKAKELHPEVASAVIDLAYISQEQKLPEKALEYFLMAIETDKNSFDAYWGLANYYKDHGNKREAAANYMKCLRLRPSWSDWVYNFIGNLYFSFKDYKKSESYYRKAVELNDEYPVYRQNLAGAFESQADHLKESANHAEAIRLYLAAASMDNTANRWNTAGNYFFELKRWKEAGECYDKAIVLNDSDPIIHENRGLVYEKVQRFMEAEQSYLKALEYDNISGRLHNRLGVFYYNQAKYDRSVEYYKQAIERSPNETVYLENICLAFETMNLIDEAEPYYLKLLEIKPDNDRILNLLGIINYKKKNYEKALEYYQNAIIHSAGNAVYYENLSSLYRDNKQYQEGLEALQKALQIQPQNDIILNNIGVLYFDLLEFDKALEYYMKAFKIKPNTPLFCENIASAYFLKQQFEEAVQYYKLSLQIEPKNPETLNSLGLIYFKLKQYETAISYYRQAIALKDNNGIYQTNLGMALMASGLKEEAMIVYQKAIQLTDNNYISWNDLGVLYYEKGNLENAIECYNKSINLQPNDPVIYSNLSLALKAQGKTREAQNVINHPLLQGDIKKQVESMLQQYL